MSPHFIVVLPLRTHSRNWTWIQPCTAFDEYASRKLKKPFVIRLHFVHKVHKVCTQVATKLKWIASCYITTSVKKTFKHFNGQLGEGAIEFSNAFRDPVGPRVRQDSSWWEQKRIFKETECCGQFLLWGYECAQQEGYRLWRRRGQVVASCLFYLQSLHTLFNVTLSR